MKIDTTRIVLVVFAVEKTISFDAARPELTFGFDCFLAEIFIVAVATTVSLITLSVDRKFWSVGVFFGSRSHWSKERFLSGS